MRSIIGFRSLSRRVPLYLLVFTLTVAFPLSSSVCFSQTVTVVCDSILKMPTEFISRFGKRIRVRITNKAYAGANSIHETLVFDENRENSFKSGLGQSERALYAAQIPEDSMQVDTTTNTVVLDSSNTTAVVNFVTDTDSSDFPDFALGYGLYFLNIEYPFEPCTIPPSYRWARTSWIIDFRDSGFAASYGVGDLGNMEFRIQLSYLDKECGPPNIDISVMTPSRSEPLLLANYGTHADFMNNIPIPVYVIFERSAPEFDFQITGSIYRGLDSTLRQSMHRTFELTHSARLNADLEIESPDVFSITNTFADVNFTIVRDSVTVLLPDARSFSSSGSVPGTLHILGKAGNPVLFRSASDINPTGIVLDGIWAVIDHADVELIQPLAMISDSGSTFPGDLALRNSNIRRTENQGDGSLVFLLQPYAIRVVNSTFIMDSCTISPADATVSRGSGILLKDVTAHTKISNSTISGFPGHGMEIVDGPGLNWDLDPRTMLLLEGNTIRNNRLYGVHIRGTRAFPYLFSNVISGNGWLGEDEPDMQSRKLDGVNIQSAYGLFQENSFDSSGAYGVHAAYNAGIHTRWNPSIQSIQSSGGNCFRWNYFNLGGSGNSRLDLAESPDNGLNAFISPRATWADPFHVTLRHTSFGYLKGNAWENPVLSASPYPIQTMDSAKAFADPEYVGAPIRCTGQLAPGGARNDSIVNGSSIDAIRAVVANEDWIAARDLCIQLLESSDDAFSATFSATTLIDALRELDDPMIATYLSLRARDTLKYHSSIAANYCAMSAFMYVMAYDSSLAMANLLAQRFLYSDHWRIAQLTAAFVQNDYFGNYYAADDILQAVLSRFPEDAQAIGAHYSVKGMLPGDLEKKGGKGADSSGQSPDDFFFEVYPNPAKGEITVRFRLAEDAVVRIALHDNTGRHVADLTGPCRYDAGAHSESHSVALLRAGYYHATLRANDRVFHRVIRIVP